MSHRRVHSQGTVPFSWEEKPGVPKFTRQNPSTDMGLSTLHILSDNFNVRTTLGIKNILVPPPPCIASQPPRRSYSMKGLRWQDDPFLAALKACTKRVIRNQGDSGEGQRRGDGNKNSMGRNSKSVFSCKQSCDVENDSFVRVSSFPPLPKERYKAKPFVDKSSQ